jgi:hypothetical protein
MLNQTVIWIVYSLPKMRSSKPSPAVGITCILWEQLQTGMLQVCSWRWVTVYNLCRKKKSFKKTKILTNSDQSLVNNSVKCPWQKIRRNQKSGYSPGSCHPQALRAASSGTPSTWSPIQSRSWVGKEVWPYVLQDRDQKYTNIHPCVLEGIRPSPDQPGSLLGHENNPDSILLCTRNLSFIL